MTFSVHIRLLSADELLIPHAESLLLQIEVSFYFKFILDILTA